MQILKGHYSPETAYLVEDYPYGFRLRCKIRYWVEYKPNFGCRMWSQTTNPKRGNIWNKPKASTFARFGLVMMINDQGHVVHGASLTEYAGCQESIDFRDRYADALPSDDARKLLAYWVGKKQEFEMAKAQGRVTCTTTTTMNGISTVETTKCEPEVAGS